MALLITPLMKYEIDFLTNATADLAAVAVLLVLVLHQQQQLHNFLWPKRSACCHHILTFYSHI